MPQEPLHHSSPRAVIQLRLLSPDGATRPLYRPFTVFSDSYTGDLDISTDGRWLAYSDLHFALHLVALTTSSDRVIGRGMRPQFSSDAGYLAYLTADILPISMPGPQGHLMVYNLRTGLRSRVGPKDPLLSDFAWSSRGDRLAWQIHLLKGTMHQQRPDPKGPLWMAVAAAAQPKKTTITRPPGRLGDAISRTGVDVRNDGSPTWTADGEGLLYWRWLSQGPSGETHRWALMRWQLPDGPASTVTLVRAAYPNEMVPPAPVVSPDGKLIVSLLGGPGRGFDQLTLYLPGHEQQRTILLPGEPRQVHMGASSKQLLVVWDGPYNGTDVAVRHAALINTRTDSVRDLGPALAAFYRT